MGHGDSRKLTGQQNQCPTCGRFFRSIAGFERHRTGKIGAGTRRCMTEAEMLTAGMGQNAGGWWVASVMTDEQKARRFAPAGAE